MELMQFNGVVLLQEYCADPWKYFKPIKPVERSKPEIPMDEILEATETMKPYPFDPETDMSVGGAFADVVDAALRILTSSFNWDPADGEDGGPVFDENSPMKKL